MSGRYAFFKGRIVPIEEAVISVRTHAFNYGTGVFEGIRAYWNEEEQQLFIFRPREHYERLLASARMLLMSFPYTPDDLTRITVELLQKEGYREDVYIRPIAYKADEVIGVRLHNLKEELTIWTTPFGHYIEREAAHVMVSSWRRINDNAIPARSKITGAYVNSALAKSEAMLNGFDEAIVLTEDGHVAEGSAENLFIIRNGVLITPPVTDEILEGITRRTLIELAHNELGIPTVERHIDRTELYYADEMFLCGTGVQLVPVVSVDRRPVGNGEIGPITRRLHDLYFDVVRGKVPKYRGWCVPVYVPEPVGAARG
ncbi:branched-chain amino acid transaminase [Thermoflexus hugenholtzii]|uniref:Branched-chain-amino-acid aminotransferase n=1 Tax=Thermoflexus hugenholtzii JAD2 TaxID=877466 RepID=A0A212RDM2_9CHLR|nr:branched-chain amino acid transaminase [Thermoflexus hugenholtzii]SNB70269.1 branched-chain amino acid aminotransferase [Thermoflexus hugenholtzii JAD2]